MQKQLVALEKIASFCDKRFSISELNTISDCLWGDSLTFRDSEKKVGQWELHFQKSDIRNFKSTYNHFLVKFGYERGRCWKDPALPVHREKSKTTPYRQVSKKISDFFSALLLRKYF